MASLCRRAKAGTRFKRREGEISKRIERDAVERDDQSIKIFLPAALN